MKTASESKRNFSKIDPAGTDPNRYASVSNPDEAQKYLSHDGHLKQGNSKFSPNVSKLERIAMIMAGSYLLYKALSAKNKSIPQTIAGGTMLARGISGYCPMYDAMSSAKMSGKNVNIRTSLTVNRSANEVYNLWRRLENLPGFMKHLSKVEEIDRITSQWTAKGPAGIGTLSWKAEILMDEPGQVLSWHSLPGSTVDNAGKIVFNDLGEGKSELDITISYHAPLGIAGQAAAGLLNPMFEKMLRSDIENFRLYLESGVGSRAN